MKLFPKSLLRTLKNNRGAVDFTTDDIINCGVAEEGLLYNSPLTIAAWVKMKGAGGNNAGSIISRANVGYSRGISVYFVYFSDSEIYIEFEAKGSSHVTRVSNGSAFDGNVQQHVLVTWDGSTTAANVHIYINGVEVSSYITTSNGSSLIDNSADPIVIGNIGTTNNSYWKGEIDEVYIWKAVLTANEIAKVSKVPIRGIGLDIQPTNLVGYYPLDDQPNGTSGDGDTFRDLGTNASNGTGNDGANNTGLTMVANSLLSYPADPIFVVSEAVVSSSSSSCSSSSSSSSKSSSSSSSRSSSSSSSSCRSSSSSSSCSSSSSSSKSSSSCSSSSSSRSSSSSSSLCSSSSSSRSSSSSSSSCRSSSSSSCSSSSSRSSSSSSSFNDGDTGMKQLVFGATVFSIPTNSVSYMQFCNYLEQPRIGNPERSINVMPYDGYVEKFHIRTILAPGSGKSLQFRLYKNGVGTDCIATISGTNQTANYSGTPVHFVAGDVLYIEVTPSGIPEDVFASWTFLINSSLSNRAMIVGGIGDVAVSSLTSYNHPYSGQGGYSSSSDHGKQICSVGGTIRGLYVKLSSAPGTSNNVTCTLYKNGVATALSVIISNSSTSGSNTSDTVSVNAGDILQLVTSRSAGVTTYIGWGLRLDPTTNGEFPIMGATRNNMSSSQIAYTDIAFAESFWVTGGEGDNQHYVGYDFLIKNLYFGLQNAPGSGKSFSLVVRDDGSDTSLVTIIADLNTSGSNTSDSPTISAGSLINLKITPTNSPTVGDSYIGITGFISPGSSSSSSSSRSSSCSSSSSSSRSSSSSSSSCKSSSCSSSSSSRSSSSSSSCSSSSCSSSRSSSSSSSSTNLTSSSSSCSSSSCSSSSSCRSSSSSSRSSSSSCSSSSSRSSSSSSSSIGGTADPSLNPVYIHIPITEQIQSFMDSRHYDPNEIPYLKLDPTTNGEITWYVDGTNGDDNYNGLYPDNSLGGNNGPFKTPLKAFANGTRRYGQRVLIRTGIYKILFGSTIGMEMTGTKDNDHFFEIGPYGDGEVVFDFSDNDLVNPFQSHYADIYKAEYINAANIFKPNHIIMDWDMRNAREAKGRYGNDNSGVNNKTTSMTDTRRDFTFNFTEFQNVPINAVGAYLYNINDRSYAIVTSVSTTVNPNDTLNFSGGLTGGITNKFNHNDPYALIHFDRDGEWFYIDHKKQIRDNSGINNKTTYLVDTTQDFSEYDGGMIENGGAFGPITGITTTVNPNDTILFEKTLGGLWYNATINHDLGKYQWQNLRAYKKIPGSEVTGVATGYYQFIDNSIHDSTKDFSGLEGALVINETTGAFSKILQIKTKVNPNDSIVCYNFHGGTTTWNNAGDSYRIYRVEDIHNHLLIKSEKGSPNNRNFRISRSDDTGSAGFRVFNEFIKFYGITFICSRSIGIFFLYGNNRVENSRIMFSGKHAAQAGFIEIGNTIAKKLFIYQNVMNNWPRGNTYGANGGWPQAIAFAPGPQDTNESSFYDGCIIWQNGGEGVGAAGAFKNGMVIDNYSMGIYFEHPGMEIYNNLVALFDINYEDQLEDYYFSDAYNGQTRNINKMHMNGIIMAAENSGPHVQITDCKIYNNIVIGCWQGIGQYYEWGPNGLTDAFIANNTVILPSNDVIALFDMYAGINIYPSTVDANGFIKNNIVIGAITGVSGGAFGEADRMNLCRARANGNPTSGIDWNNNLYSYPGEDTPFTRTSGSINPKTFAEWKADTGWDANTIMTDNPDLFGNGLIWIDIHNIRKKHLKLLSSSPGRNSVPNLSSFFTTDFDGNPRPASGNWDAGALIYQDEIKKYTKENRDTDLPTDDSDLPIDFIPVEYNYVSTEDNKFAKIRCQNQIGVYLFKDKNESGETPFQVSGKVRSNLSASIKPIRLQIYNRNTGTWETLDTNSSAGAYEEFTLQGSKSTGLSNYYDVDHKVTCRIYQESI